MQFSRNERDLDGNPRPTTPPGVPAVPQGFSQHRAGQSVTIIRRPSLGHSPAFASDYRSLSSQLQITRFVTRRQRFPEGDSLSH